MTTHYLFGTAGGPHPIPRMVREFHRVIGQEARAQVLERTGRLPDVVCACVGGGSNAIGIFYDFIADSGVRLVGLEAAGDGVETGRHAATITGGSPGVLHGARSYLLQDANGQTIESHSISAGLDYPGVGPEHAWLHDVGRAEYRPVTDAEAMQAFALLCRTEGIIPAIESAHALAGALVLGPANSAASATILVNLSGRGDKDVATASKYFGLVSDAASWPRARCGHDRCRDRGRRPDDRAAPSCWQAPEAAGRAALIGYLPVGYPDVPTSIEAMRAMVAGGADVIEVGVPYSDPGMDGPTIQAAVDPAVRAGVGMADVLAAVTAVRQAGAVPW